jgi:hypothetical protein
MRRKELCNIIIRATGKTAVLVPIEQMPHVVTYSKDKRAVFNTLQEARDFTHQLRDNLVWDYEINHLLKAQ